MLFSPVASCICFCSAVVYISTHIKELFPGKRQCAAGCCWALLYGRLTALGSTFCHMNSAPDHERQLHKTDMELERAACRPWVARLGPETCQNMVPLDEQNLQMSTRLIGTYMMHTSSQPSWDRCKAAGAPSCCKYVKSIIWLS